MRIPSLVIAVLGLSVLTACSAAPEKVGGEAGPAGSPFQTVRATVSATPSKTVSVAPSAKAGTRATPTKTPSRTSEVSTIRTTDWAYVKLENLGFMGFGDTRFRGGKATSGANTCTMLPGGVRPAYGEYITEEPASSPVTEDALILIECGSDGLDQALVPVKLGFDQRSREAIGFIDGDGVTFTSFRIQGADIVTTVRKPNGSRETRRYQSGGGSRWELV